MLQQQVSEYSARSNLANKAENPSLGLNLWRARRMVSCGAAERVASSPSCQLAVSACVLDSVSVPEYFLLSAVLSIDRHMMATCGSCEDAGWEAGCCHGSPSAFRWSDQHVRAELQGGKRLSYI